jgi:alkylated DNA nucleotide flippase Atl1
MVRRVPRGRVATYGDIAAAAGRPRAHRAVGNIMRTCHDSSIPCKLGGYGRDLHAKRDLLMSEGVLVSNGRIRKFETVRWKKKNLS